MLYKFIDFALLIAGMNDSECERLHGIVWAELEKRLVRRVKGGYYPSMTDAEKALAKENKINASMLYNDNTKLGIMISKMVVEVYLKQRG